MKNLLFFLFFCNSYNALKMFGYFSLFKSEVRKKSPYLLEKVFPLKSSFPMTEKEIGDISFK